MRISTSAFWLIGVGLPIEPGLIDQTSRGDERVDCGTVVGITMSGEEPVKNQFSP